MSTESQVREYVLLIGFGELGRAILTALTSHPPSPDIDISLLLRRPPSPKISTYLKASNVGVIFADVATSTTFSLSEIFRPFTTVIGCTGMTLPSGTQRKLAHAAIDARVRRYIPWQFGVDYDVIGRGSGQDLFDEQLDVRDLLRSTNHREVVEKEHSNDAREILHQTDSKDAREDGRGGFGWVIVSTGIFTSFLFEGVFGVVSGLSLEPEDEPTADPEKDGRIQPRQTPIKVRAIGGHQNQVSVTNVTDIGRVVAKLVHEDLEPGPAARTQGVIHVCGETLSYDRLAQILEDVIAEKGGAADTVSSNSVVPPTVKTKRQVVLEEWPLEQLTEELATDPSDGMKKYRLVFGKGKGVWWNEKTTWDKGRVEGLEGVKAWVERNLILV